VSATDDNVTAAGASTRGRPRTPRAGHLQRPGSTRVLEMSTGSEVRRSMLPSGLRVITERIPGVRSASVGLWVQVGSRDERPEVAGAAHYLEHLLFKGTARRSAAAIAEEIDAVGGELNAFTAKEHTCYYAHVLDEDLPLAVDLVADVVFEAICGPRDFETERGVVLEEIAMRDDDPEDLLHDAFIEALFGGHALGRPVLGTEKSIQDMERDALYSFYKKRYTLCAWCARRSVTGCRGRAARWLHERAVRASPTPASWCCTPTTPSRHT
jgi:predicted Zn-dependent peptidase